MHNVNISEFRAHLLSYLEQANAGEQILITSNGKLLATVVPPIDQKALAQQQLKALSATAKVHDVVSPIDADWDAA